ncbi:MAG: hypothetical protein JSR63_02560 [Proteobacteria bacterium]|nr:hypothetical protein [Pseudomonadota bacterium]MBS0217044.1 hypothetical protein [Pseudomonadota bacterium]
MHDHAIQCTQDPLLVALSYLVSVLGSFTALQLAVSIPVARNTGQRLQSILGAAAALGIGAIWAMHFIAMLACKMDMQVTYDLPLTVLSAIIGLAAVAAGLAIVGTGQFNMGKLALAGILTGLGVAGMHYTGMAAMRMPAEISYDDTLVIASVAVAIVASCVALWLAFNLRGWVRMLGSALMMAVAVCGMHYTGMAAAKFIPVVDADIASTGILGGAWLGMGVFAIATVLLSATLVITILRRQKRADIAA